MAAVKMTPSGADFGDDTIIGGAGDDELWGNYGNDVFVMGAGRNGSDIIYGLTPDFDKIAIKMQGDHLNDFSDLAILVRKPYDPANGNHTRGDTVIDLNRSVHGIGEIVLKDFDVTILG